MDRITSDLAKKSKDHQETTRRWSPYNFRRDNIAGPHGMLVLLDKSYLGN